MPMMNDIAIQKAAAEDLPAILSLQKIAYLSEAALHDDHSIQPLTQTLEEVESEYRAGIILKAVNVAGSAEIIGSVRGVTRGDTVHIGKLMVHPARQNRGIGTKLLQALEKRYPGRRCELFTSSKSEKNLSLYTRNGYTEFKRETDENGLVFVFLEKNPRTAEPPEAITPR